MIWVFFVGVIVGMVIGRAYEWMKWHYPESVEMIRVKTAERRVVRLRIEEEEEEIRSRIDASLDRRMSG